MTPEMLEDAINSTVDLTFFNFDKDNNGYLDSKELLELVKESLSQI